MSDIALNFDPLLYGGAIALAVAPLGTPLAWGAGRGLARLPRALLASLACIGTAGLASLAFALSAYRLESTSLAAVLGSAVLQALLLPVLLLLSART